MTRRDVAIWCYLLALAASLASIVAWSVDRADHEIREHKSNRPTQGATP